MAKNASKKTAALRAMTQVLIILLDFHWWVVPVVSAEEKSILLDANVLDTNMDTGWADN